MNITRMNTYDDARFSPQALQQHGCYLVDGKPCELLIIAEDTALVTCADKAALPALVGEFRFHAPHITRFVDQQGTLLHTFPPRSLQTIAISDIQPSQFFVDEDKLAATETFIHAPEDVIIQVLPCEGRYIALDGHTRLFLAIQRGWTYIRAVTEPADESIFDFVSEAQRRNIRTPADLTLLSHAEYEVKWNRFCDDYFSHQQ